MAEVELICGDITLMDLDAIVCPAHKHLIRGRGLSAQIYDKAGEALVKACAALQAPGIGEAVITKAYNMPAKYIIHTVTPQWSSGDQWGVMAIGQLRQCYESVIRVALDNHIASLAFPALGAGTNRFPHAIASHQALDVLTQYADQVERLVVCLPGESVRQTWLETLEKFYPVVQAAGNGH